VRLTASPKKLIFLDAVEASDSDLNARWKSSGEDAQHKTHLYIAMFCPMYDLDRDFCSFRLMIDQPSTIKENMYMVL